MLWWQVILFPFAILYDLITRFRNHLFNIGYTRSFRFQVNTICIGNLSVGGSGKSPMVEMLTRRFLEEDRTLATLSRGYGRGTRGFLLGDKESKSSDLGDEPLSFAKKFAARGVAVAVGEDRAMAIPQILFEKPATDLILLDDAFQHRRVEADVNILLTTYDQPFFGDFVMPSGTLREARHGASRADVIVVTKSPKQTWRNRKAEFERSIQQYAPDVPVFFASTRYLEPVPFGNTEAIPKALIAVAGIAQNQLFFNHIATHQVVLEKVAFADHHHYQKQDIRRIQALARDGAGVITTEKDYVKLCEFQEMVDLPSFYVPIEMNILEGERQFFDTIGRILPTYPPHSVE